MKNESKKAPRLELLQAVELLTTARDALMICSELLREYQFSLDSSSKKASIDITEKLIEKLTNQH